MQSERNVKVDILHKHVQHHLKLNRDRSCCTDLKMATVQSQLDVVVDQLSLVIERNSDLLERTRGGKPSYASAPTVMNPSSNPSVQQMEIYHHNQVHRFYSKQRNELSSLVARLKQLEIDSAVAPPRVPSSNGYTPPVVECPLLTSKQPMTKLQ